jgi:hypothetical protein
LELSLKWTINIERNIGDRSDRERGEYRANRGHLPLLRQGRRGHRGPVGHDGREGLQDQGGSQESKTGKQGHFRTKNTSSFIRT